MSTMEINVKTLDGRTHKIANLQTQLKVKDLKVQIKNVLNVLPDKQRLIFQGKVLKDEKDVLFYAIKNGVTIHMVESIAQPVATPEQDAEFDEMEGTGETTSIFRHGNGTNMIFGAHISMVGDDSDSPIPVQSFLSSLMSGIGGSRNRAMRVSHPSRRDSSRRRGRSSSDRRRSSSSSSSSNNNNSSNSSLFSVPTLRRRVDRLSTAVSNLSAALEGHTPPSITRPASTSSTTRPRTFQRGIFSSSTNNNSREEINQALGSSLQTVDSLFQEIRQGISAVAYYFQNINNNEEDNNALSVDEARRIAQLLSRAFSLTSLVVFSLAHHLGNFASGNDDTNNATTATTTSTPSSSSNNATTDLATTSSNRNNNSSRRNNATTTSLSPGISVRISRGSSNPFDSAGFGTTTLFSRRGGSSGGSSNALPFSDPFSMFQLVGNILRRSQPAETTEESTSNTSISENATEERNNTNTSSSRGESSSSRHRLPMFQEISQFQSAEELDTTDEDTGLSAIRSRIDIATTDEDTVPDGPSTRTRKRKSSARSSGSTSNNTGSSKKKRKSKKK